MQTRATSCRFDIDLARPDLTVYYLDCLLSLALLAHPQPLETLLEEHLIKDFLIALRTGIADLIDQANIHRDDFTFSFSVIHLAIHHRLLSRRIRILFEEAFNTSGTLVDTATGSDMGLHDLVIVLDCTGLTDDHFLPGLDQSQPRIETSHEGL